jgi:hypothetical protein
LSIASNGVAHVFWCHPFSGKHSTDCIVVISGEAGCSGNVQEVPNASFDRTASVFKDRAESNPAIEVLTRLFMGARPHLR